MTKKRTTAARRSAAEWADDVRAWRRSGQTAARYAKGRGLTASTLSWWGWKLAREGIVEESAREVDLVEVAVVDEVGAEEEDGGWELTTADGHQLRGSATMGVELAEALVRALMERR